MRFAPAAVHHSSHAALGALMVVALSCAGCYFEGAVSYHPQISQRVTTPGTAAAVTGDGGGWSAGVNIGFYLDVAIRNRYIRGLGAGWSPSFTNGYGIAASKAPVVRTGARGNAFRFDFTLPVRGLLPYFHERVTLDYHFLNDVSATFPPDTMSAMSKSSSGRMWFLGATLAARIPVHNGTKKGNIIFALSLGPEHYRSSVDLADGRGVSVSSTGIGARLMMIPAFIGTYHNGPYEGMGQTGGRNPRGNCSTTDYIDEHGDSHPVETCNN